MLSAGTADHRHARHGRLRLARPAHAAARAAPARPPRVPADRRAGARARRRAALRLPPSADPGLRHALDPADRVLHESHAVRHALRIRVDEPDRQASWRSRPRSAAPAGSRRSGACCCRCLCPGSSPAGSTSSSSRSASCRARCSSTRPATRCSRWSIWEQFESGKFPELAALGVLMVVVLVVLVAVAHRLGTRIGVRAA